MDTKDDINWQRLVDYLAGEAPPEEQRLTEQWLQDAAKQDQDIDFLHRLWDASQGALAPPEADEEEITMRWRQVASRIHAHDFSGSAARPAQGSHLAALPRPRRTFRQLFRVAAVVAALAVTAVLLARYAGDAGRESAEPVIAMQQITTEPGQRAGMELSDGTRIRMNVASKISFTSGFAADKREVYLEGEAFFQVAPDAKRPFIIHAGNGVIQVLGTQFDVRAYEEENEVRVAVTEGTVSFEAARSAVRDTVVLNRGQLGKLTGAKLQAVREGVDLDAYLAWTEGRLVFHNARFDEVAAELQRWYRVDVNLAAPAERIDKLNASFGDEPLSEILNNIAAALNLRYERDRRRVTFYPLN